jgi:hypothetical protein
MARRRGMSQTVPGAVDVETDDGLVIPVTPEMADMLAPAPLGGPGASAPLAWGGGEGLPMGDFMPPDAGAVNAILNAPRTMSDAAPADPLASFRPAGFSDAHPPQAPALRPVQQPAQAPAPTQPSPQMPAGGGVFATRNAPQQPAGPSSGARMALLDQLTNGAISGQPAGGGSGGPRVTTTTTGTQESLVGTPEQQAALADLTDQQYGLRDAAIADTRAAGERNAAVAQQQAEARARGDEQVRAIEAQRMVERRPFEEAQRAYLQRANQLTRDVAAGRIDRSRIWNDENEAGRVSAAISLAVGAFANGLTGAPNLALDTINEAIDRDIQEQLSNLDAQRGAAADARAEVQMGRELLGDFDEQTSLLREAKIASVLRSLEEMDLRNQPAEIRAAAEQIARGLEEQRVAAQQAGVQSAMQRVVREQQTVQRRGGGGGGRRGLSIGDAIRVAEFAGQGPQEAPEIDNTGIRAASVRLQDLNRADEAIGRLEGFISDGDIPGVGLVGGRIPDASLRLGSFFGGDSAGGRALEARRALRDATGAFTRIRTGAGMPLEEAEKEAAQLGLREDATVEEVINGIRDARALIQRDNATIRASVDPTSLSEFDRRVATEGGLSRSSLRTARRPGE